jgi:hypothetical protein
MVFLTWRAAVWPVQKPLATPPDMATIGAEGPQTGVEDMSLPILLALIVLAPTALVVVALSLSVAGARIVSYLIFPLLLVAFVLVRSAAERGRS